jgi:hypothetical protein
LIIRSSAELGVVAVRFAGGTTWRLRRSTAWLGRPDRQQAFQCLDAANAIVAVEGTVLESGVLKRCRADGVLVAIQP